MYGGCPALSRGCLSPQGDRVGDRQTPGLFSYGQSDRCQRTVTTQVYNIFCVDKLCKHALRQVLPNGGVRTFPVRSSDLPKISKVTDVARYSSVEHSYSLMRFFPSLFTLRNIHEISCCRITYNELRTIQIIITRCFEAHLDGMNLSKPEVLKTIALKVNKNVLGIRILRHVSVKL